MADGLIADCYMIADSQQKFPANEVAMEMRLTIIYEQMGDVVQATVAELPGAISLGKTREEARVKFVGGD